MSAFMAVVSVNSRPAYRPGCREGIAERISTARCPCSVPVSAVAAVASAPGLYVRPLNWPATRRTAHSDSWDVAPMVARHRPTRETWLPLTICEVRRARTLQGMIERTTAWINVAAVERNVQRLVGTLTPSTVLCAVVKADGYGHGAAPIARAAQAGGAARVAVVTAEEALQLRAEGVDGDLLVLGPVRGDEVGWALDVDAELVVTRAAEVDDLVAAGRPARLHVKLDSGMGRLGEPDPDVVRALCDRIAATDGLRLVGVMTHFATADEDDDRWLQTQLERFTAFADAVRADHPGVIAHVANSAATLRMPESHFDMVRTGIAIYGLDPFHVDPEPHGLEPALRWTSRLVAVKPCAPGDAVGYARRFVAKVPTTIGTVAVGYGDGVRRALTFADPPAEALVGGRRVPLAGTVSMDSFAVDLGAEATPAVDGDEVTLISRDGDQRILAEEVAARQGTINYEVTCGISPRVPRVYHRDGVLLPAAGP
jgi:alanine racemase